MIQGAAVQQALAEWLTQDTLILGVGSLWRGDDAAGPLVCEGVPGAVDCGDAPERFLGLAGSPQVAQVLLVDAVDLGAEPGEVVLCEREDLTERFGTTHSSGLALLARYLAETYGKEVRVLGIQPASTGVGCPVSGPVRGAVERVVAWLARAEPRAPIQDPEGSFDMAPLGCARGGQGEPSGSEG